MQELQRDIDTQSKTSILQFLQFFCNGQSTLNPGSFYPLFSMFAKVLKRNSPATIAQYPALEGHFPDIVV